MSNIVFEKLMDELNIIPGDVLFVHSSWDRIKSFGLDPIEIINKLKHRVGQKGLLCMPTYPWLHPMTKFDPKKIYNPAATPSVVGFLSEVFRRCPDVYRSANPFFPIAAFGGKASDLVFGQENIKDLFDNESVFGRLLALNVKQLGLGVSVGLSTFIHIADWRLRQLLNFKISEEVTVSRIELPDRVLTDKQFLIIPQVIFEIVNSMNLFNKRKDLMDKIIFKNVEGNFTYSYYVNDMLNIASEEAENALKTNNMPCWFTQKLSDCIQKV